jgi:hypothetical protein
LEGVSAVSLKLRGRPRKANFSTEIAQASVGSRGSDELQAGADGLSETRAAGSLGLLKKFFRDFHRYLPRYRHDITFLTVGVGALQIVLDKGQEDDWFGSHFITTLAVIAVVGLVSLVVWEWFHKEPIVDVRLFKNFDDHVGARIEPGPTLNFVSISSEVEYDAPALSSSSNEGRKNVV